MFQKFAWKNRNLLKICLEKLKFFKNLLRKIEFLSEIARKKSKLFENLPEKSKFFYPDPRPSRLQTRLTPLLPQELCLWTQLEDFRSLYAFYMSTPLEGVRLRWTH